MKIEMIFDNDVNFTFLQVLLHIFNNEFKTDFHYSLKENDKKIEVIFNDN